MHLTEPINLSQILMIYLLINITPGICLLRLTKLIFFGELHFFYVASYFIFKYYKFLSFIKRNFQKNSTNAEVKTF